MMEDDWRTAARYGMSFGIGLAIAAGGIGVLHSVTSSPQLRVLSYVWMMAAIICAFLAGFIAARACGSFTLGVDAGAIACAVPLAPLFLFALFGSGYQALQTYPAGQYLPDIINATITALLLFFGGAACGAVIGGLVGSLGALFGRIQASLYHKNNPLVEQEEPPIADDETLLVDPLSADIDIPQDWPKILLLLLIAFLLAGVAYSTLRSGEDTALNWIAICLFGLGIPPILMNLLINHPLLRFSEEGIAYRGGYFWLRGRIAWHDVSMIDLRPAVGLGWSIEQLVLGRYELSIFASDNGFRKIRFLSWQLPSSTRRLLRAAMIRYHKQIEKYNIIIMISDGTE